MRANCSSRLSATPPSLWDKKRGGRWDFFWGGSKPAVNIGQRDSVVKRRLPTSNSFFYRVLAPPDSAKPRLA